MLGLGGLVRGDLRRRDRRLGVELGHAQERRRARREPVAATCCTTFAAIVVMVADRARAHVRRRCRGGAARRNDRGRLDDRRHRDADTLARLPEHGGRGWFAVVEQAALGFAIATLARSQLAGIGAGIAFYFGETFASIFLPDIVKYMPFAVARASIDTGARRRLRRWRRRELRRPCPPDTALVLVAVWLVGSLIVAAVFTERAEITG